MDQQWQVIELEESSNENLTNFERFSVVSVPESWILRLKDGKLVCFWPSVDARKKIRSLHYPKDEEKGEHYKCRILLNEGFTSPHQSYTNDTYHYSSRPKQQQLFHSTSTEKFELDYNSNDKEVINNALNRGPYFDTSASKNVTALVGKTAYLNCRIRNLGNKTVTWIRHRDLHLLTVDKTTYTSDQRFVSVHNPQMGDWSLQVRYPQRRDSGVYECQVSTTPPVAFSMILSVVDTSKFSTMWRRWPPIMSGAVWFLLINIVMAQQDFGNDVNIRYNPQDTYTTFSSTPPPNRDFNDVFNRDAPPFAVDGNANQNFGVTPSDPFNRDFGTGNRDFNNPNRDLNNPNRDLNNPNRDLNNPDYTTGNRDFGAGVGDRDFSFGNRNRFDGTNRNAFDGTNRNAFDGTNRNTFESTINSNRGRVSNRVSFLETLANNLFNEPTYFIVASRMVRPGQVYRVAVQVISTPLPITVRASVSRDGVEMSADSKEVKEGIPETLLMRVPSISVPGNYKLRVEGMFNQALGGIAFINETKLTFSQRSMTIFVQTDKPTYMQGETVKFRTIPITTALRGFDNAIDVYMIDPHKHILRRWLSRQSNLGTVSLEYKLSDQPVFGEWTIRIIAQGQIEEHKFHVEEYYQTRFEVNVTMPAFFFNSDPYIYGKIMANFTSGAPVRGNLTIKATIRPIGWFNAKVVNQRYRVGNTGSRNLPDYHINENFLNNPNLGPVLTYGPNPDPNYPSNLDPSQQYPQNSLLNNQYQSDQYTHERHFNFDEEWPFWVKRYESQQTWDPWSKVYRNQLPYLRFFNGTFEFKYPMSELAQIVPSMAGMEVMITATVGERFYDEVIKCYSIARVYNSSIKVSFLGGSPQVFKPTMTFMCYIVAEYHDGSPIPFDDYYQGEMEVSGFVESRSGGRLDYPIKRLRMSETKGIWELKVDLRNDINIGEDRAGREFLHDVQQMRLSANFIDGRGERANADLLVLSHHSPQNRHIKVTTSTQHARVGEYIILHVQNNFFMESFNYILMSKGNVLLSGQENMQEGIRTMAVTLSAEMAPVATVVVWHIAQHGLIVADSLTFPVNGISRNNFTVFINNRKARTGERVEVAVYGEPGAYVGLSGIDNAFYTMQAGNELTYAKVITKMSSFDEQTNGTHKQTWYSHEGNPDELVYYPLSSYGIDANRTFEYSGLVVFTDGIVPRRHEFCNRSLGLDECLNGRCYRLDKKCDGFFDCEDGTDEINCQYTNFTSVAEFRKYRFNRVRRHYENVWLWKDINIGPHGRFIFSLDVPEIPAQWMVSAFSISPTMGFGMIPRAIEYVGVQPFFINVEMPTECRQGEQVGIRVTVFNYQTTSIEATVVLHGSPDFKFVHVGENGIVRSYNPETSFGEHQFFIYLEAQSTATVYLPIVPTRLGDIEITVHGSTLLGADTITRKLHVEADGLPQYRHQSILLDLRSRAYVFQYMHVNVTETPIIPYDVDRYFVFGSNKARISVVGDVVGPIFATMPVNATSMIYLPMDSAEQNMFSFAANLYTIMYMRLINQRNKVTEKNAFYHMNIGYQRQLSFMMPDGSFSLFRSDWNTSASSTWLTAYCARIFQEASFYEWENYIYIDPLVIQKSIRWLLRHQTHDGAFYEVTWSPDRKANGSLHLETDAHIRHRNISLTAHVLITLAQAKDLAGSLGARVAIAQQKAIQWLDRNLNLIKEKGEPYEIALVAYALKLQQAPIAEQAFGILADHARTIGEYMYWGNIEVPQPPSKLENQKYFSLPRLPYEYDSTNIETTAYALLTYVSRHEIMVDAIVRWLTAQRLHDGGWASTSDTSVAMKALIEYTMHTRIRDVSQLSITVEATSLPGQTKTLYITDKNLAKLQTIEIPNAWGTVKVQAKGAGYAILQMHVQYNVDIEKFQTRPPITAFDLNTKATFHGRNQSHITYVSCQRWTNLNESIRSGMAVLDVAIPTGYWIQQQRLDAYILSGRVRNLQRARYREKKVLFYFDYLDHEDICVNFTMERWYPVANMSRYLPIRVYDYYAPERFNETIFDALPTYILNICEVCGSSHCPYCSIYNAAVKSPVSAMLIIAMIVVVSFRHFRITRPNASWFVWNE